MAGTELDFLKTAEDTPKDDIGKRLKEEDIAGRKQDREQRLAFGNKIYLLACFFLAAVFIILCLSGFRLWGFWLSDTVLVALLSSTTIDIIGLLTIMAAYYYKSKKR